MAHSTFKAIILVPFILFFCTPPKNTTSSGLGEVQFTATGKKEALPHFEKGLLLLHSFEYMDAAEEFRKARTLDPAFAMAYWGEAMTHNHPLWRYQDYEKATAILQVLAPDAEERAGKAKTEIEKDLIRSLTVLYGKGSKAERDKQYARFMENLYEKYKGNPEVATFYSLALIGSVEIGRDEIVYGKAAAIAKEVLAKHPRHPGALHYLIHAYDDPQHAAQALATADAYALTAPDAGHALHMPTHIYLALGMWDKVVTSNEVSWAAGEKRKERKKLSNDALNYHAFHWLLYGYLQQGEKGKAKKLLLDMKRYNDEMASGRARAHLIFMKTTYLSETADWDSEIVPIRVPHKDLNIVTRAKNYFIDGWHAFHQRDEAALAAVIQTLAGERLIDVERATSGVPAMCGSTSSETPNLLDVQYAEVMEIELRAMQASLKNDVSDAEKWLKKATALENSISYSYGPPDIVKPSNELYGEWLLEVNRPQEAETQFDLALKAAPKRVWSVKGKEKANKALGHP